jgi:hypothetical protein
VTIVYQPIKNLQPDDDLELAKDLQPIPILRREHFAELSSKLQEALGYVQQLCRQKSEQTGTSSEKKITTGFLLRCLRDISVMLNKLLPQLRSNSDEDVQKIKYALLTLLNRSKSNHKKVLKQLINSLTRLAIVDCIPPISLDPRCTEKSCSAAFERIKNNISDWVKPNADINLEALMVNLELLNSFCLTAFDFTGQIDLFVESREQSELLLALLQEKNDLTQTKDKGISPKKSDTMSFGEWLQNAKDHREPNSQKIGKLLSHSPNTKPFENVILHYMKYLNEKLSAELCLLEIQIAQQKALTRSQLAEIWQDLANFFRVVAPKQTQETINFFAENMRPIQLKVLLGMITDVATPKIRDPNPKKQFIDTEFCNILCKIFLQAFPEDGVIQALLDTQNDPDTYASIATFQMQLLSAYMRLVINAQFTRKDDPEEDVCKNTIEHFCENLKQSFARSKLQVVIGNGKNGTIFSVTSTDRAVPISVAEEQAFAYLAATIFPLLRLLDNQTIHKLFQLMSCDLNVKTLRRDKSVIGANTITCAKAILLRTLDAAVMRFINMAKVTATKADALDDEPQNVDELSLLSEFIRSLRRDGGTKLPEYFQKQMTDKDYAFLFKALEHFYERHQIPSGTEKELQTHLNLATKRKQDTNPFAALITHAPSQLRPKINTSFEPLAPPPAAAAAAPLDEYSDQEATQPTPPYAEKLKDQIPKEFFFSQQQEGVPPAPEYPMSSSSSSVHIYSASAAPETQPGPKVSTNFVSTDPLGQTPLVDINSLPQQLILFQSQMLGALTPQQIAQTLWLGGLTQEGLEQMIWQAMVPPPLSASSSTSAAPMPPPTPTLPAAPQPSPIVAAAAPVVATPFWNPVRISDVAAPIVSVSANPPPPDPKPFNLGGNIT